MSDTGDTESWEFKGGTFTSSTSWRECGGRKLAELDNNTKKLIFPYNQYVSESGNIVQTDNFESSGFIDVDLIAEIYGTIPTSTVSHNVAYFDKNRTYIGGSNLESGEVSFNGELTDMPEGSRYVIFSKGKTAPAHSIRIKFSQNEISTETFKSLQNVVESLNNKTNSISVEVEKSTSVLKKGFPYSADLNLNIDNTFAGTLYAFPQVYVYFLEKQIYGQVSNFQIQCDSASVVQVYKYNKDESQLIEVGTATANSDGLLSVPFTAEFNGEFIAFKSSSKMGYRNNQGDYNWGLCKTNGAYYQESSYEYSIKFDVIQISTPLPQTTDKIEDSLVPLNGKPFKAYNGLASSHKALWKDYTMTSSGAIYENPAFRHTDYLDANGHFFNCENLYFDSSVYAWLFFDKYLKVLGGYKPSTSEYKTIEGKLPDIPSNAKYVVFNQKKQYEKDIFIQPSTVFNCKWSGKEVLFLGDSFFAQNKLVTAISDLLGCTPINRGVSGSTVAGRTPSSNLSIVDRIDGVVEEGQELPVSCDAVIINCSTNDYGTNVPIGIAEGGYSDKTTFYGGVHYVINKLTEKYPNAPIIWINATHRNSSNLPDIVLGEDNVITESRNTQEKTLRNYVEALEEVCGLYSIPVVDAYRRSRIQPFFLTNKELYTLDGLHPNEAGSYLIALLVLEAVNYISD